MLKMYKNAVNCEHKTTEIILIIGMLTGSRDNKACSQERVHL